MILNTIQPVNNAPTSFVNMYDEEALAFASLFLNYEHDVISELLSNTKHIKNLVVVGSGPGAYLEIAQKNGLKYIGIDPYFSLTEQNNVYYIDKDFEEINREMLPKDPCLFLFWFNVIHYLKDPWLTLKKIVKTDDLIVYSTWSSQNSSLNYMNSYFKAVYKSTNKCYKEAIDNIRKRNIDCRKLGNIFDQSKNQVYSNGINVCSVIFVDHQG